jgi:hypothetical protein
MRIMHTEPLLIVHEFVHPAHWFAEREMTPSSYQIRHRFSAARTIAESSGQAKALWN